MIQRQDPWQGHRAAAQRKNVDTPSLGWACFEEQRFLSESYSRISDLEAPGFLSESRGFL